MNDDDLWIEEGAALPDDLVSPAVSPTVDVDVDDTPVGSADEEFVGLGERISRRWKTLSAGMAEDPGRAAEAAVSLLAVVLGTLVVAATLDVRLLLSNTTPTGGDMGAHVWGPNYLMHHLLPNLRLSGWTHDWFNGFPAYQFYMVIPSLVIVALNVGVAWWLAVPIVLAAVAGAGWTWNDARLFRFRKVATVAAAVVVVLSVSIPYNVSFKVVTGIGLLAMPLACWAFAKLSDLPFPIPPIASVAGLVFVFNREPIYNNTGNIIGGNFQSTMAGEFAFSISLTLAILYLGVAVRGLRTGRHRGLAAALFALASLSHLIPAFFVLACTIALFLLHPDRVRLKWMATMVPVAGALTAFWILPFWWRRDYVNDMGWERLPIPNANTSGAAQRIAGDQQSVLYYLFPQGIRYLMIVAAVGVVVSFVRRYRVGLVLGFAWLAVSLAFWHMPQYRLWNARLLPFMYLSVALLAAIAVGEVLRLAEAVASGGPQRRFRPITVPAAAVVCIGVLLYVVMPIQGVGEFSFDVGNFHVAGLHRVPVTRDTIKDDGSAGTETVNEARFSVFGRVLLRGRDNNPASGWSKWNYSGLQAKKGNCTGSTPSTCTGGWPEYREFVATMARLGADPAYGCGRAMWEYDSDRLNTYGTTMAPMLLPYWTNGCIASQEGLYFESTPSVPVHFLVQSELSAGPSRPQRDLPYPSFDIDAGIRHLQLLGVRYYVAMSDTAVQAASKHPDLKEVAVSGPWHVFLVAKSQEVAPLRFEPVIADGIGESQDEFLPVNASWFLGDQNDVPLAVHGPKTWQRVQVRPIPTAMRRLTRWVLDQSGRTGPMDVIPELPRRALPDNRVSDVRHDESSISFSVSRTGVPVLVSTSYFPNWTVSGAAGPYRVTPNLMVVVPTSEHVTMRFARTPPDLIGIVVTLLGLVGLVLLARARPLEPAPLSAGRLSERLDALLTVTPKPPRVDPGPMAGGDEDRGPAAGGDAEHSVGNGSGGVADDTSGDGDGARGEARWQDAP